MQNYNLINFNNTFYYNFSKAATNFTNAQFANNRCCLNNLISSLARIQHQIQQFILYLTACFSVVTSSCTYFTGVFVERVLERRPIRIEQTYSALIQPPLPQPSPSFSSSSSFSIPSLTYLRVSFKLKHTAVHYFRKLQLCRKDRGSGDYQPAK